MAGHRSQVTFVGCSFASIAVVAHSHAFATFEDCTFADRVDGATLQVAAASATVKNCNILSAETAILATNEANVTCESVSIEHCRTAAVVRAGAELQVEPCTVSSCTKHGLCAQGKRSKITLNDCTVADCIGTAVLVEEGAKADLMRTSIAGSMEREGMCKLLANTRWPITGNGLLVQGQGSEAYVTDSKLNRNASAAIAVDTCSKLSMHDCRVGHPKSACGLLVAGPAADVLVHGSKFHVEKDGHHLAESGSRQERHTVELRGPTMQSLRGMCNRAFAGNNLTTVCGKDDATCPFRSIVGRMLCTSQ